MMSPHVRKAALCVHVTTSVGWIGSIVAYLPLAVAGMVSADAQTIRGVYPAMHMLAVWAIVPFSVLSFASGVVQSLGTSWGLFRHYWVLFKLILNLAATLFLLAYVQVDLKPFVRAASQRSWTAEDLALLGEPTNVVHAAAALALLIGAVILAVYKPRGLTRYGRRRGTHWR